MLCDDPRGHMSPWRGWLAPRAGDSSFLRSVPQHLECLLREVKRAKKYAACTENSLERFCS